MYCYFFLKKKKFAMRMHDKWKAYLDTVLKNMNFYLSLQRIFFSFMGGGGGLDKEITQCNK